MLLIGFINVFHVFFAVAMHVSRHIMSCSPVMPAGC